MNTERKLPVRGNRTVENTVSSKTVQEDNVLNTVMGRPTKYNPDYYIPKVLELGKLGYTKHQMALEMGIALSTLANWCEAHTDFLVAVNEAVYLAQGAMEKRALSALDKPAKDFNTALWGRMMAARFSMYRETQRHEHTTPPGTAPVAVAAVHGEITAEQAQRMYEDMINSRITGSV